MLQALTCILFSETFAGAAQCVWTSLIKRGAQCLVSTINFIKIVQMPYLFN
jgi:hypothetical protein